MSASFDLVIDRPRWRLRDDHVLVNFAIAFNLWSLRAERLSVLYPNDSGMHLQMTAFAANLLRHGLSPFDHWYPFLSLGSSFFVQYQSFSAVLAGGMAIVFGAHAVLAWSLYLLLSFWPVCVYWSARLFDWEPWESAIAAVLSPLLFAVTGRGFGHQSYIWIGSGLWSQLWAMWTLPLAWALSWRYVAHRKSLFAAVVALSLTIVFHFLTAYLAGLTLGVWVLIKPSQFRARTARALLLGLGSLLATAWVSVPLVMHSKWLAVNQFQIGTPINDSYGARHVLSWLLTGQIYDWHRWPVITTLVALGLVSCLRRCRDERARAIVGAWTLSLVLFFGRPTLGALLDVLPAHQDLLLQRYIMGVQMAGLIMAGVGTVATVRAISRWVSQHFCGAGALCRRWVTGWSPWQRTTLTLASATLILAPAWTQVHAYDATSASWITFQRSVAPTQGTDVSQLVTFAQLRGGGRIYAGMPSNWGRHFYVGAVPVYIYLEQLNVDAIGFTLRTSGLMTDPEAYFDENSLGDYSAFGVRYVITPVSRTPGVRAQVLLTRGDYRLWQVSSARSAALIQVVDTYGSIVANNSNLGPRTSSFLLSPLPGRGIYSTITFSGSPRAASTLSSLKNLKGVPGEVLSQSENLSDSQSASATLFARRRAVVLFKVAYDPGWHATVDGRPTATLMLAPALLGVRVSPGRHVVVFTYQGFGLYDVLVPLSILTLLGFAIGPWWWHQRHYVAGSTRGTGTEG